MSSLYLAMLCGVAIALLWAIADAVLSVSRKPDWSIPKRPLALVETVERRSQSLPFVGGERRQDRAAEPAMQPGRKAA